MSKPEDVNVLIGYNNFPFSVLTILNCLMIQATNTKLNLNIVRTVCLITMYSPIEVSVRQ